MESAASLQSPEADLDTVLCCDEIWLLPEMQRGLSIANIVFGDGGCWC